VRVFYHAVLGSTTGKGNESKGKTDLVLLAFIHQILSFMALSIEKSEKYFKNAFYLVPRTNKPPK
jgi:hypothetical protein